MLSLLYPYGPKSGMRTFLISGLVLIIHFVHAQQYCFTSQPETGEDAFLASFSPNINYGLHEEFASIGWTCNGEPCTARCLIRFDLSSIPSKVIIDSAKLTLYAHPSPQNCNGVAMNGFTNISLIQRVIQKWNENAVTWNTQPLTTAKNQVILPQSVNSYQNYPDIDISSIMQDIINNPDSNFGFMLRLESEQYYNSMIFASSDHPNLLIHPMLKVCYTIPTGNNKDSFSQILLQWVLDPLTHNLNIKYRLEKEQQISMSLIAMDGRKIYISDLELKEPGDHTTLFNVGHLPCGIYFLTMNTTNTSITKKVIIF